ncbi:spermatogenesis-associated protein 20 [Kipferlia bialata]|uniref:Spermatogenesis-associated protein 20 n=1 Tax=Kipferlia bialata TaxID=797122 RepID=A0A9K3CWN4_9EUKA|nr:spermatogenesis-associated protein 20 [Kipferlia bialata]|eukprot:g5184.t1
MDVPVAVNEDKLLLVSVGYSACHWCHVMAHECFEDTTVATFMNEHFVCVKVDREEHPNVDKVYMDTVTMISGSGGWPLNCFALPDGRPVFGGTYWPKASFLRILSLMASMYQEQRAELLGQSAAIHDACSKMYSVKKADAGSGVTRIDLTTTTTALSGRFDHLLGGMGEAPKFPMPCVYEYLLGYAAQAEREEKEERERDGPQPEAPYSATRPSPEAESERVASHVAFTLECMARGGIHDQVGGGFCRYSVDAGWHIPHFEKMLYDNGQLMSLYSHACIQMASQDGPPSPLLPLFRRVVSETASFLERELLVSVPSDREGESPIAFLASLDADSEGGEGAFYAWTHTELREVLGETDYPLFADFFGVSDSGNWEKGLNILKCDKTPEAFALSKGLEVSNFLERLSAVKSKLLDVREQRSRPGRDTKALTAWNAMTVVGLVDGYRALSDPGLLSLAVRCGTYLRDVVMGGGDPEGSGLTLLPGQLMRVCTVSTPEGADTPTVSLSVNGFLEDYAHTVAAFLALYRVTFEEEWVISARLCADHCLQYFPRDMSGDGTTTTLLPFTSSLDPALPSLTVETEDNVIPASNSVMCEALLSLGALCTTASGEEGDTPPYTTIAKNMLRDVSPVFKQMRGLGHSNWARLFLQTLTVEPVEVCVLGPSHLEWGQRLRREVDGLCVGARVLIAASSGEGSCIPLLSEKEALYTERGGPDTLVYICAEGACMPPCDLDGALDTLHRLM